MAGRFATAATELADFKNIRRAITCDSLSSTILNKDHQADEFRKPPRFPSNLPPMIAAGMGLFATSQYPCRAECKDHHPEVVGAVMAPHLHTDGANEPQKK